MSKFAAVLAAFLAFASPVSAQMGNGALWERMPSNADFARLYPERARAQHTSGRVLLDCLILSTQRLRCSVAMEDPRGLGFGAAALQLAREYRIAAHTRDGRSTAGGRIRLPLSFTARRRQ